MDYERGPTCDCLYNQGPFYGILVYPVTLQATSPAEERQDVTVLYNKMTLGELQNTYSLNVSVISYLFCVVH